MNFAPASDPRQPGTISFSGKAKGIKGDQSSYIVSLTGSTIELGNRKGPSDLTFTLSGTMTQEAPAGKPTINNEIGFNSSMSLVGTINESHGLATGLKDVIGLLTPSAETQNAQGKVAFTIGGENAPASGAFHGPKARPQLASPLAAPSASGAGALASATVKSTVSSAAGSSQFGSLVTFTITYGANGGPNWILRTFKGPAGAGSAGQLLSASRTHTATLQLTFVAACNDDNNFQTIENFWQSIPKCNGTQQAQAAASGQALNYLAASGRAL